MNVFCSRRNSPSSVLLTMTSSIVLNRMIKFPSKFSNHFQSQLIVHILEVANNKLNAARGRTKHNDGNDNKLYFHNHIHLQKVLQTSMKITWQVF